MSTSLWRHPFHLFLSMSLLSAILIMQFATFATSSSNAFQEGDRIALKAFKSMIDPQEDILNSWNDSRHFCEWEGITCSRRHSRRVTVIALIGSLSPYIGNLSFLRGIDLMNNTIRGEIPHEFGRLPRLEFLQLANNTLAGEIPANLSYCSRLWIIDLGTNKLVGYIPFEFFSLYKLKILILQRNNLTGEIPPFIGNLTILEWISLGDNAFGGTIPHSLGQLKEMGSLGVVGNNLSGTIPPSIYNLSMLYSLSVGGNHLHGSLPPSLGLTLPNLKWFDFARNFFSGTIPISLANASKLEFIELSSNRFSRKLSVNFGGMKNLSSLNVIINNLGSGENDEMNFMSSLTNCSKLQFLYLGKNQFRGALHHSIANMSNQLLRLTLNDNLLYGSIPPGIGNLVKLYMLYMEKNRFTGTIPKEMGKLQNLQMMSIYDNRLSGEIPSSLGNMSSLFALQLYKNNLSGAIPSSLGNLKQLAIFNLSQNDLSGTIPEEIFNITNLSHSLYLAENHFIRSISPKIGNLKVLRTFNVSGNNLSGEIPRELGLCFSLEEISLAGNLFHGSIPSSLNSLKAIRGIDLSRNNLSGQIPMVLESLSLEYLNLSFNDLAGEVPTKGIFSNASAISVAGCDKLCGGILELQLPKCIKKNSGNQKISGELKALISTLSVFSGLFMVSFFFFCWLRSRRGLIKQPLRPSLLKTLQKVSYETLLKATDGFSSAHLIGVGSFGSVYKGVFGQDGIVVAIKVLNLQHRGAFKSFMAECKALKNIRHRNLVKVITSCTSIDFQGNDFVALVYEYMPNGSLENWLHPDADPQTDEETKIQNLTLLQRLSIALDVASVVDYLHHHCQEPILHCDLKPSNILLDNDLTAHVGDFGLARFFQEISNPTQSSSIGVRGTIGYAAPEYGLGSELSTNGDVYSYGILLLEIVTSKKPTNVMFVGDLNLHNFARMALPDHVMDIVDPIPLNDEEPLAATGNQRQQQARRNNIIECLSSMVRIGVSCSMESPGDRLDISNVVRELQSIKNILVNPRTVFNGQRGN